MPAQGEGQGRGNSGVFLMGLYELQVLDSFENETYADGQAAAIYGQHPPLVNACLPPGQWQTYDIVFRRPRFEPDGALAAPARMTAFHNGVLVQDSAELWGPTMWLQYIPYKTHPDKLPISLQDHGNPLRYRNIWLRELRESKEPGPAFEKPEPVTQLTEAALARYVGMYKSNPDSRSGFEITSDGAQLHCLFGEPQTMVDLVPHSNLRFSMRWTAAHVEFELDGAGKAQAMTLHVPGAVFTVKRFE
ncbi:MAG: family 16 glycoside hydrolase, partial [Planctomycetota bacterium]